MVGRGAGPSKCVAMGRSFSLTVGSILLTVERFFLTVVFQSLITYNNATP